jgi:hypothetical protein
MYSLAMLIVYSLNFLYMIRSANKEYWRSHTCTNFDLLRWKDSSEPPAKLFGFLSTLLLLLCAVNIPGAVCQEIGTDHQEAVGRDCKPSL